jgi:DNA-binding transcriptional LysR family regulator
MPFDIRQLRYAIAAADHGSFYRAAQALNVEQSTLSRSILRLERTIGATLFTRSRAGVAMTIVRACFIRSARPMVANADRIVANMRAAGQGRAGSLIVGHNSSVSAGNLRASILAWQKSNPEVDFKSVEKDRGTLLAGIDASEIDIAILLGDAGHNGYRREPFWSERILVAAPVAHALANREIAHWTDLRSERFVLPEADPGPDIRDLLLGRLSQSGTSPDIRLSPTSRETVLSLLGAGSRISVVCEGSSGVRYPDVVYKPVYGEQGPALASYSGYWRDDNANPPLKRFLSFIRDRYALSFDLAPTRENRGSPSLKAFDHDKN